MKKQTEQGLKAWGVSEARAKLLIKLAYQLEKEHGNNLEEWAVDELTDAELKELTEDQELRDTYYWVVKYESA